jgi:hypothetical protein
MQHPSLAALVTNDPLPESLHPDGDWFQPSDESDKIKVHKVMLDASTSTTASFAAPESWSALHERIARFFPRYLDQVLSPHLHRAPIE